MKRTLVLSFAFLLLLLPARLNAGDIFSGEVSTLPQKIFVNQPFEIFLEVEITPNEDIDNISIQGFPTDPSFITLGQLEQEQTIRNRKNQSGEMVDVLRFHANARCHKSLAMQFNPVLSCNVVQRRSRSFFSFSTSSPRRIAINPFKLIVHELPLAAMPENFTGAVGKFTLKGDLSKNRVRPGDIITLRLELNGKGWLNNSIMPSPAVSKEFKSYPPKEIERQNNRIATEQIFIPISTNANELAAAHFAYFNPQTERYEECRSPAFRLEFISAESSALTNQVKIISTDTESTSAHPPAVSINIREVNAVFHQILPVVIAVIFVLSALFIFLVLRKVNKWVAAAALVATLAAGTLLTLKAARYQPVAQSKLKQQASVYLTPSTKSTIIMKLQPATLVTPLESAGRWVRIESSKQRGWIEQDNLVE